MSYDKDYVEKVLTEFLKRSMNASIDWATQQLANMTGMTVDCTVILKDVTFRFEFTPVEQQKLDS